MSGTTRRVVAATENPVGRLTVVCDDGSVFVYDAGQWRENDPVPGTEADQATVAEAHHQALADMSQRALALESTAASGDDRRVAGPVERDGRVTPASEMND